MGYRTTEYRDVTRPVTPEPMPTSAMARLRRITEHIHVVVDGCSPRPRTLPAATAATSPSAVATPHLPPHLTALTARQLKEYASRGVVVVPPEQQGAAIDHAAIWEKMNALQSSGQMPAIGYYDHFPELAELISGRTGKDTLQSLV